MKLIKALEIANECGLTTVNEALLNIDIHAMSIFKYDDIQKEVSEMYNEWNIVRSFSDFKTTDRIDAVLEWLKRRYD